MEEEQLKLHSGEDFADDDQPALSSHALAALKEFLAEQSQSVDDARSIDETGVGETAPEVKLVTEDWRLSQFWYEPETARTVAQEVLTICSKNPNFRVACIACPTLYAYLKKNPAEENEEQILIRKVSSLREIQEKAEAATFENSTEQKPESKEQHSETTTKISNQPESRWSKELLSKLSIPERDEFFDIFKESTYQESSTDDGYETAEEILSEDVFTFPKSNISDDEEEEEEPVPKEKIMRRIDSHKGMKSYQLAQQLSSKWSTGAGPRISCMRDYPSELQLKVLEQAHLSPRARTPHKTPFTMSRFSPKVSTPSLLSRSSDAIQSLFDAET